MTFSLERIDEETLFPNLTGDSLVRQAERLSMK